MAVLEVKFGQKEALDRGDPLSPFLFTILGDVLCRMIHFCYERNIIRGFFIGSPAIEIIHLQYADDVLIFSPSESKFLENWWGLIQIFLLVSGLSLNVAKTAALGSIAAPQKHIYGPIPSGVEQILCLSPTWDSR